MPRRPGPIAKSVKETRDDLLAGHAEASFAGPAAALKYLQRVLDGQVNLPLALRPLVHDRMAEAQAQLQDWEGCAASVTLAMRNLGEMEAELPHEDRQILSQMTCFERGIQAHTQLGQFREALALCESAVALDLGSHFEAKRDSLSWAAHA